MPRLRAWFFFAALCAALALWGCGGGGASGASSHGGLRMTVKWPTGSGRLIPKLADRLRIRVGTVGSTEPLAEQMIQKPAGGGTSRISVQDLPTGKELVVSCDAYQGPVSPALATASVPVTLKSDADNVVILDLVSTIDHLEVTGTGVNSGSLTAFRMRTYNLVVTGYSAANEVVPIAPSNLSFHGSNDSTFTVSDAGTVTTLASLGSGTVEIRESESGKLSTVSVSVVRNPGVASIRFSEGTGMIVVRNQTRSVTVQGYDEDGVLVGPVACSFTSSSPSATVSWTGTSNASASVKGISAGNASIVATDPVSSLTATLPVVVNSHGTVTALTLSPNPIEVALGFPDQFLPQGQDAFGNSFWVQPGDIDWSSDHPEAIGVGPSTDPLMQPGGVFVPISRPSGAPTSVIITARHRDTGVTATAIAKIQGT